ncbi:MAG: AAA family ATPase [Candidatus Methylacidiphilales bacterium]|nr:AAA family ATPase [Candidatus Methylacidiphilales bacterium]
MNLLLSCPLLRELRSRGRANEFLEDVLANVGDQQTVLLRHRSFTLDDAGTIRQIMRERADLHDPVLLRRLELCELIGFDILEEDLAATVEEMSTLIDKAVSRTANQWIYHEEGGELVPYYLYAIRIVELTLGARMLVLDLTGLRRGRQTKIQIEITQDTLTGGASVTEVMEDHSCVLESERLTDVYLSQMEVYIRTQYATGAQYLARLPSWHEKAVPTLDGADQVFRVVMDDAVDYGREDAQLWDGVWIALPLHLYLQVFDLRRAEYLTLHISYLTEYKYDTSLVDKLILPPERKSIVNSLLHRSVNPGEDLITGKSGGIIILCTGDPGTGKTLTAEVYAEATSRPLYVAQCSRLGTDPQALEEAFRHMLDRAKRWNAILLLDEADVYIHERGHDLTQNAIVGVFLRLLEYYSGVLFMTSNRATIIDDAILSRVTAHLRYTLPDADALRRIWGVLSAQYKLDVPQHVLDEATGAFPRISGRSVKQLIRLSKIIAESSDRQVDMDIIRHVAQFQDLEK